MGYTLVFTGHVNSKLWSPFHLPHSSGFLHFSSTWFFHFPVCFFLSPPHISSSHLVSLTCFISDPLLWPVPACWTGTLWSYPSKKSKGQFRRMEVWPFRRYLAEWTLPKKYCWLTTSSFWLLYRISFSFLFFIFYFFKFVYFWEKASPRVQVG